jgi:Leucine-rich repeat (LRR) protein
MSVHVISSKSSLFLISFSCIFLSSIAITPLVQIQSLEFLYNSTNGENWFWKNEELNGPRWSFTFPQSDPCNDTNNNTWQGVLCSSSPNLCQHQPCDIVSLQLNLYGLDGTLPLEMFESLIELTNLEIISSPRLIGAIPETIGLLRNLQHLSLLNNNLTGIIPNNLGSLQNVTYLELSFNHLEGDIPSDLGSLSQLQKLYLENNHFTGTIPPQLGSLPQLVDLYLDTNQFIGSIPSEFGKLFNLAFFTLYSNHITGTIPSELGSLPQLVLLSVFSNQLTGIIPSIWSSSSSLIRLDFNSNLLSGPIPSQLGFLTAMTILSLYNNQLTSSIPHTFGSLVSLEYLDLFSNLLTSSIPSQFGNLKDFQFFGLSSNLLSHSIPSEIGSLTNLQLLDFSTNCLTGLIPSSLNNLFQLSNLGLSENHLSGQVPLSLSSFLSLEQLFIHKNQFTGDLDQLIPSASSESDSENKSNFNFSSSVMINFDISDNQLTGTIPSALFLLPHLRTLSLSLNCFKDNLPSSMCNGIALEVIAMDGLGSAEKCKHSITLNFITSVTLGQRIGGTIPQCVWLLTNLQTLNLAGNGLSGTISNVAEMFSLSSMTLAHNYLSGVIPLWLQVQQNMTLLDLSHNKLTGDVDGFNHLLKESASVALLKSSTDDTVASGLSDCTLKLQVNRLSGDLSKIFSLYGSLDILSGNLFSCEYLPSNDKNSEWVSCGSEEYDQTMSVMGGVLGLIFLAMLLYGLCSLIVSSLTPLRNNFLHWLTERLRDAHALIRYTRYTLHFNLDSHHLHCDDIKALLSFGSLLFNLIKLVCLVSSLSIICSLPLYILKETAIAEDSQEETSSGEYVTHTHMYRWRWTMAFLSGSIPAIIFMITTLICLIVFYLLLNQIATATHQPQPQQQQLPHSLQALPPSHPPAPSLSTHQSLSIDSISIYQEPYHRMVIVWLIFFLNIAVVGTMNGLYLWSTLVDLSSDIRIGIQVSFGFSSFLWTVVILRTILPFRIRESRSGVWLFSCLCLMNNVAIPCIVTSLSSPSCYQVLPLSSPLL